MSEIKLSKRKARAFGKDCYLLGRNEYGEMLWLESPVFDCGWYWGFGYVEVYTLEASPEDSRDITSHSHFDSLVGFKSADGRYIAHLNESPRMQSTVLTDRESWELCDLMKTFYTLKAAAEVFHLGGSHLVTPTVSLKDANLERTINQEVLPKVFNRVIEILTPKE